MRALSFTEHVNENETSLVKITVAFVAGLAEAGIDQRIAEAAETHNRYLRELGLPPL